MNLIPFVLTILAIALGTILVEFETGLFLGLIVGLVALQRETHLKIVSLQDETRRLSGTPAIKPREEPVADLKADTLYPDKFDSQSNDTQTVSIAAQPEHARTAPIPVKPEHTEAAPVAAKPEYSRTEAFTAKPEYSRTEAFTANLEYTRTAAIPDKSKYTQAASIPAQPDRALPFGRRKPVDQLALSIKTLTFKTGH